MREKKQVFMIGGPNGAGKTTTAFNLLPELAYCSEYVNADSIAASLSPFHPDSLAIKSGKLMLARIDELIVSKKSFAFESTMASKGFLKILQHCKQQGYVVNLLYIWVQNVELAVERVHYRVRCGGHFIPGDTVVRRYYRSMKNFLNNYSLLADRWSLCDNSYLAPSLIAQKYIDLDKIEIIDTTLWQQFHEVITDE